MENLDAFEALLNGDLSSGPVDELTDEELEVINRKPKDKDEPIKGKNVKDDDDDLEEEPEVPEKKKKVEDKKDDATDLDDLGEYEEQISTYVKSKLEEKLGMTLGEHKTVGEIVDELANIVEASTSDVFANEEIEKLNEYVANGGDLKKFYSTVYSSGVDLDNVDIDNVSEQKKIVKENLKNSGYNDKQIERMLTRYEDSGVLQEEAEDAVEVLKVSRDKNKEKLLETQQKEAAEVKKRNERFVSDVQKSIKELKEVFGIAITDKDKRDIYQALLVPESDGKTKYQKEYSKDVLNLITSAFFTIKGKDLVKRAQDKGASSTAKDLKDKLSQKGNRLKNTGGQDDEVNALNMFAGMLRKN